MALISYLDATKVYQKGSQAGVHDVTLDIEQGDFVVLLGPSGCGKTTLLKTTNRLIELTSGEIEVGGRNIRDIKVTDLRRHMGYVIQQVGLFPHLTVAQNIATVPKLLSWSSSRIKSRTEELLDLVGLPARQYAKRYPKQLSGGQQQRVGLARAMAADPSIMLMDEPFGAIDAITRTHLQDQLVAIQRKVHKTVLFVTHDVEEALKLADRIVVMREGYVVQYDTPFKILTEPADEFVRELLDTDDVLRQLSLVKVTACMLPLNGGAPPSEQVSADKNVRDAVGVLLSKGVNAVSVVNGDRNPIGYLTLDHIRARGSNGRTEHSLAVHE